MATPQQLLQTAKGQIKQPNTQGTRGAPGRGGVAARPGGGASAGSPGGGIKPPDTYGGGPAPGWKSQPDAPPGFKPRAAVDPVIGADLMAKLNSGREPGGPGGPAVEPGGVGGPMVPPSTGKPLWQQIQDLGGKGTGSFAGNRELLAKLQAAGPPPGGPPSGPVMAPGGDMATSSPGVIGPAGGAIPPPPLGADIGPGGGAAGGFPGFKPRPLGGGMVARPMPATVPQPDMIAQTMPGQLPGGLPNEAPGGFGDIARVGADMQARRQMRPAVF